MATRYYLDYNASTPLDPRVAKRMSEMLLVYGNPSSIHAEGREARALVDEARVSLGQLLNCDHHQILFTSGGTEANNLAILGFCRPSSLVPGPPSFVPRPFHIITSSIEHSSVLNPCKQLQASGFDVTFVPPTNDGMICVDAIENAIQDNTKFISVMMANNEVGTIQPIADIASLAHKRGILVHTDAIQALGKIPVNVEQLGVDLLSISAHKIYGPKGVGALYWNSSMELSPLLRGGSHEKGLRAGTENVLSIDAFGLSARLLLEEGLPDLKPLRDQLEKGLKDTSVQILCKEAERLPNTLNFYSDSWLGESMVMALDLEGIAVSNGSACSAGIIEPSHVIQALGYNDLVARSVIRVSFGKWTRPGDIDYFLKVIHDLDKGAMTS